MADALKGRDAVRIKTLPEHPTPADQERYRRITGLFSYASELPLHSRESWLRRQVGVDEEMVREILDLLRSHEAADDFLRSLPQDAPTQRNIGPYRTRRVLGQGGMGTVYLAYRADLTFRKEVAIKVIHQRGELARQFVAERQILASLEHPFIARLLDGGTTEEGFPYLVMEFVAGEPIDIWCDRRKCSVDQRLGIFRKVCSALIHAHRAGVIHLDLKPSNILVDAEGNPKLLDFGIAQRTILQTKQPSQSGPPLEESKMEPRSPLEAPKRPAMTLGFASPEQLTGAPASARSDIFSLGLILYGLLTGRHPFPGRRATSPHSGRAFGHSFSLPPAWVPPSQAIDPSEPADVRTADLRATQVRTLRRRLRGGLETVLAEALQEEPDRRYESVSDLVAALDGLRNGPSFEKTRRYGGFTALAVSFSILLIVTYRWWRLKSGNARSPRTDQQ